MRYLVVLLMLCGCTHAITLFPRGGGEQATGTVNDGSKNMEVELRGNTYTGKYVLGQTVGVGFASGSAGMTSGAMVGTTNNATALLTGSAGILRCEFRIVAAQGGNGMCVDGQNVVYDMLIK